MSDQSTTTSGKTDANWSQKNAVFQGFEISLSKEYIIDRGVIQIKLSRDDISAIFDDNTYIPRVTPARNILSARYDDNDNTKYSLDLIHAESQGDFSSIEAKTNSYINLNVGFSKIIPIGPDQNITLDIHANNILNKTIRNHESFVKDNVPTPGANFGMVINFDYKL